MPLPEQEGAREHIISALRQSRLCDGLKDEDIAWVAGLSTSAVYPAGTNVCEVGDSGDKIFVVVHGRLMVSVPEHGEMRLLAYLSRGEHFGEVACLGEERRTATVSAVFDSELVFLESEAVGHLLERFPRIARNLIKILGSRLKDTLSRKRRRFVSKIVGVVHLTPRGEMLQDVLLRELAARGERIAVVTDLNRWAHGSVPWAVEPLTSRLEDRSAFAARLHALLEQHNRLVIDVSLTRCTESLADILPCCEEVLWLVEHGKADEFRRTFCSTTETPSIERRSHLVWILDRGQPVAPLSGESWAAKNRNFKVELGGNDWGTKRRERLGVDRIVRYLRGMCVGLALGGGGARGLAHLGMLRAFDRVGVGFDLMVGTSSGALVGLLHAAGYDTYESVAYFQENLTPHRFFRLVPWGKRLYLQAMFRLGAWERMMRRFFYDWRLEHLQVPLSTVTVDLVSGRQVIRERGDATHAVLESINHPVISAPIKREGRLLVDGGLLNNLPADVVRRQGADLVVGANVTARMEQEFAGNRPEMRTRQMKSPGWMETLFRSFETQAHEVDAMRAHTVDLLIKPDTERFAFSDFTRAEELADAGEAAAEEALPRLRKTLEALDGGNEL